ncbi:MAG: type II secretion system protein [Candidatus Korobacteraceae bacterium]
MMLFGRNQHPVPPDAPKPVPGGCSSNQPERSWLRRIHSHGAGGFTLIELIVAITLLLILTSAAVPIARVRIKRDKERELRRALWEIRDSIDRYKDAADRGAFQIKLGSEGYPPDLQTLVDGVDISGKKVRFLRRIPTDPMTGTTDWGKRCMSDDPDSTSWCGDNVFDVYSTYKGNGLDGTDYAEW